MEMLDLFSLLFILNDEVIAKVKTFTDLGVVLDKGLTFDDHVRATAAKGASMLGFIKRTCCQFKDPFTIISLYKSLVRSHLEYCSVVWNTVGQATYVARLEKVQRSFTRYALKKLRWSDVNNIPSYDVRLQMLALETLDDRRLLFDVSLVHDLFYCF